MVRQTIAIRAAKLGKMSGYTSPCQGLVNGNRIAVFFFLSIISTTASNRTSGRKSSCFYNSAVG